MGKKISMYTNWDEIAIALKEMAEIRLRVKAAENTMNKAIAEIKECYEGKVRDDLKRIQELEENTELFCKAHAGDFADKKSKEFTFGKVGFRKTSEIVTRNIKAILGAVKLFGMDDCVIVKESLDKEALAKYDDAALLKVGAKRKESEKYYYEVYEEVL